MDTKRSRNFKQEEIDLLLSLVTEKKEILECKKTDNVSVKEKEIVWKTLAEKFNESSGFVVRDWKTLKGKYENLKKTCKKRFAEEKKYVVGTGGGPSQLSLISNTDLKIKELLGDYQVEGLCSQFDSDSAVLYQSSFNHQSSNELIASEESTSFTGVQLIMPVDTEYICDDTSSVVANHIVTKEVQIINDLNSSNILSLKEESGAASVPLSEVPASEENQCKKSSKTQFSIRNLREPISNPLKRKKIQNRPSLDDTLAGRKLQELSQEKQQLLQLQHQQVSDLIKFQKEEHELKMKNMSEEHNRKIRLLDLEIQNKELDLKIKNKMLNS